MTPSDLHKYDVILGIVSEVNGDAALLRGGVRAGPCG